MTTPEVTFGRWLRQAREDQGLNQQQVADVIGVSRPQVSKWERDKARPDLAQFQQLIDFLGARYLYEVARDSDLLVRTSA